jgi:8-oxo-dGTP diphosphatase
MAQHYVLGFAFTLDKSKVVLIKKDRPVWQAGKLNGVGGKVELMDLSNYQSMVREFYEETGVPTEENDWKNFARMDFEDDIIGGSAVVHCFCLFDDNVYDCSTYETEEVMLIDLDGPGTVEAPMMINVPMLIEMALLDDLKFCAIQYK